MTTSPQQRTGRRLLHVAVAQAGELTEDLAGNLDRLSELVVQAGTPEADGTRVDLVVLPELCTTPYFCTSPAIDRTPWAQSVPGPVTETFGGLARELGCAIAFGMYERSADGRFHNAAVVVGPDGEVLPWHTADGDAVPAYRKLSLPANHVGGVDVDEKSYFSPGGAPVVLDVLGTRIACVICYDRSFPEYWAVARALGAEVVLAVVSSLGFREDLFLAELSTRAMESQTWVVAANRGGAETLGGSVTSYFGRSAVIDPTGLIIAQAPAHSAGHVVRAVLDLDVVPQTRAALPLARDRRPDVVALLSRLVRS